MANLMAVWNDLSILLIVVENISHRPYRAASSSRYIFHSELIGMVPVHNSFFEVV